MEQYTPEQFWKFYKKLPQELKDALFAEETGNAIYDICKRNEVLEKLGEISDHIGQVLLGVLLPGEFQEILEKKMELDSGKSKKIFHEINRLIFSAVKHSLAELYGIIIAPSTKSEEKPEEKTLPSEKDTYREPIE